MHKHTIVRIRLALRLLLVVVVLLLLQLQQQQQLPENDRWNPLTSFEYIVDGFSIGYCYSKLHKTKWSSSTGNSIHPLPTVAAQFFHPYDHNRWIRRDQSNNIDPLLMSSSSSSSSGSSSNNNRPQQQQPTATGTATVRAGADGYSLLRQPVKWDLDKDPVFDIPESLVPDETRNGMSSSSIDMEEWWSSQRKTKSSTTNIGNDAVRNNRDMNYNSRLSTKVKESKSDDDGSDDDDDDTLDLFQRSFNTLDFPRIIKALYKECATVPGKRLVQNALTVTTSGPSKTMMHGELKEITNLAYRPLLAESVEGCQERYSALQEMQWLLQGGNNMTSRIDDTVTYKNRFGRKELLYYRPPPFVNNDNGFNLEGILERATTQSRVLDGFDIVDILDMINTLENVHLWGCGLQQITEYKMEQLSAITSHITVNATLQQLLQTAFDKDLRLSGETFPRIGQLRDQVRSYKSEVMGTLDNLIALPSIQSKLSLESGGALVSEVQGGRLVIPVDRKYASTIGVAHDSSRSGKTVYVEPNEIITSTNKLRQTENELRAEEARVWRLLTEEILGNQKWLETAVAVIGQLDLILARINLGSNLSGVVPIVQNEGVMVLQNAKHPVLLLRGIDNVVGSDITLGTNGNQGLILTGPNAGGKTVILKLLGLMALMARCGIPVPASAATTSGDPSSYQPRVDFFDPVLADIGDIQSVGGDLSTFSGHMLVCREVLQRSGKNALILMDELGSGTDPNQGVAIAQALLEAVVDEGARVAITTHYMQLKQLAASDDRFSVAGMQFQNGRPTYKLLPGQIGESFALSVAERLGLPSTVLQRANELLDSETRQMGDLLRELEAQKMLIDKQVEALEKRQEEMNTMKTKMEEEMIRLENQQLNIRRIEARKFAKMLEEKEAVLEDILEKLKSDPSRRIVAKSWDEIKFIKRDALKEAENIPSVVSRKQVAANVADETSAELVPIAEMRDRPLLKEGDKIIICERGPMFAREATIVKALDSRVEVKVNNMNVSFKLTQVALVPESGKRLPQPKVTKGKKEVSSSRSKAVELAMSFEGGASTATTTTTSTKKQQPPSEVDGTATLSSNKINMRTESNTIDVRGCNLMDAQERIRDKISMSLVSGRSTIYVLHGHGTGGVLKTKIRTWLKYEKLVKSYSAADPSDGGDAFTRIELR